MREKRIMDQEGSTIGGRGAIEFIASEDGQGLLAVPKPGPASSIAERVVQLLNRTVHPERVCQKKRMKACFGRAPIPDATKIMPAPPLDAVAKRNTLTMAQLLGAYRADTTVVWRTFLVPTELFYATGALPFTPETACAVMARNQDTIDRAVGLAEECGYGVKRCSFLKAIIGGIHLDVLPTPDLVVGSSSFCDGIGSILQDAAEHFRTPFFYLNLPLQEFSLASIAYVAGQLRRLGRLLCEKTGADPDEVERTKLPHAIELSSEASRLWKDIERLRYTVPSPLSGREAMDFATALAQTWGCEEIVEIYRHLRNELRIRVKDGFAAVPSETVRLLWMHLRPYYSNDVMRWIESAGGAVVFEEVNFPVRGQLDPSHPYETLARAVLLNAARYRIFTEQWKENIRDVVKFFKVDGIIHFAHDNCAWSETVFPPMYRFIRDELRMPLLSLDGDCLIMGRDRLMNTRVHAFLENFASARISRLPPAQPKIQKRKEPGFYVGLDVGSTAIKAVVVDDGSRIRGMSVLPTGANNRDTANRVLALALAQAKDFSRGDALRIVVTGVGRGNVSFGHEELTELTCHTGGVLHVIPDAGSVIDIGGQDTKVVLVKEGICRLNNSCASGTGRFLEAIARALRVSLMDLGQLDGSASEAVPISKMCTVFAESEVVNRVASGADPGSIVRGVHEMVANRAATLLRQVHRKIVLPVVFTGGVAMNAGIVRALERCIGGKVSVPENPQFMGALGAALIARGIAAE